MSFNEDSGFLGFLRDTIKQEVGAAVQGGTGGQQSQTGETWPQTVTLGDQTFTFNSPEEMKQAITQLASAAVTAQQEAAAAAQTSSGPTVEPQSGPAFSPERYVELIKQDPVAANEYLLSYQIFGGAVENPSAVMRDMMLKTEQMSRTMAAMTFKSAHPEYVATPQNAQIIDAMRQQLGLSYDADGLEAAYATAVARGMIKPNFQQPAQEQAHQAGNSYGYAPPPPPVPRGTVDELPPEIQQFEQLSLDQMEAVLGRLGLK